MKHSRFLCVLALVCTLGLSACGSPQSADQSAEAAEQFFAERGGGTAASGSATDVLNQPFVIGTVESVAGATINVKNLQGESISVRLTDDTTIQQEAEAQASEIQPGAAIMALGAKADQAFQARLVQLGAANPVMEGMAQAGAPAPGGGAMIQMPLPEGAAPGGGAMVQKPLPEGGAPLAKPAGEMLESVAGTVKQVDGKTITVQTADGSSVTIQLTADAKIQKRQTVKAEEIQPGTTIMASGSKQGEVIEARQVQILPNAKP